MNRNLVRKSHLVCDLGWTELVYTLGWQEAIWRNTSLIVFIRFACKVWSGSQFLDFVPVDGTKVNSNLLKDSHLVCDVYQLTNWLWLLDCEYNKCSRMSVWLLVKRCWIMGWVGDAKNFDFWCVAWILYV